MSKKYISRIPWSLVLNVTWIWLMTYPHGDIESRISGKPTFVTLRWQANSSAVSVCGSWTRSRSLHHGCGCVVAVAVTAAVTEWQ